MSAVAATALRAAAWPVVLWRFSRPHTVIGTVVSIVALWSLAPDRTSVPDLLAVILAGLCVNVFIVGINQIYDVEIDRVNKPFLPIAAGALSVRAARAIVGASAVVPLAMGLTQGPIETAAVAAALVVGWAYSCPPLRLKRFPLLASLSITLVRAVVVNLGVYAHFAGGLSDVPGAVWALMLFVLPFSFAIAVLKDVPDVEGDRRYAVRTFSVRLGGRRVLGLALAALTVAYLGMAVAGPFALRDADPVLLVGPHLLALGALLFWARRVDVDDPEAFTAFYMRVWQLFFLEYLLVPLAVLA